MGIPVGFNEILMAVKGEGLPVEDDRGVTYYPIMKGLVVILIVAFSN